MFQEITFSPATMLMLMPIMAWLIWAIRRLVCRGMCDCHGKDGKKGTPSSGGCAHCSANCAAAAMAERLEDLADAQQKR